jgi:hypothetical protein
MRMRLLVKFATAFIKHGCHFYLHHIFSNRIRAVIVRILGYGSFEPIIDFILLLFFCLSVTRENNTINQTNVS